MNYHALAPKKYKRSEVLGFVHTKNPGPVKNHLSNFNTTITEDHIDILASPGERYLLTLEALYIQELEPKMNTKDEWRSRTMTLKM